MSRNPTNRWFFQVRASKKSTRYVARPKTFAWGWMVVGLVGLGLVWAGIYAATGF